MKKEYFLAILIPMYNEEMNAEKCVISMCNEIRKYTKHDIVLVIINDGSADNTLLKLEEIKSRGLDFIIVSYKENRGYGGAVMAGAEMAYKINAQFALVMDSDLTNDPKLIPVFYEKLKTNKYDYIKASRYIEGGKMVGVPFKRQWPTVYGNKLASFLFDMGINDCTNGFRAFRLSLIVDEKFKEKGFPSILEELYILKKRRAIGTEIPYTLTARTDFDGQSKFSYSPIIFYKYLKYAFKAFFYRITHN